VLKNADLAELLAADAKDAEGVMKQALKRAARSAFLWPEHAADLLQAGRSLTELHGVGPSLAKRISVWIEKPRALPRVRDPLRRDFLTLADARIALQKKPEWAARLRGDLQMHTRWSDGSGTVQEMAEAAAERDYEYIAITDHTKGLRIAGGIDEAAVARQGIEIAKVNAKSSVTVLRSVELNLNPRGEGDMDRNCLAKLDLVLGSFHSALRKKEDQTDRYLAALHNSDIQTLGHPRGRIYNYRIGLRADWSRVFDAAAKLDKALEIDSYPDRQDLNVSLLKLARKSGCRISIGTDAHHATQFGFIELGLAAALIAKIPAERIINFLPLAELKKWVASVRPGSGDGRRQRAEGGCIVSGLR
jgi:histidinol phosphatase-like PHP family hydrolase